MEGLTQKSYQLAAVFCLGGVLARVGAPAVGSFHNESWMEAHSLQQVGQYRMLPSENGDSSVTYKMNKDTYEVLNPSGIVCRDFTDGSKTFDVVLVASSAKDSFHDPRICFGAQGWNLEDESSEVVNTNRGAIPFTVASIRSTESQRWAAFGYKGPDGFVGDTNRLKLDLFGYSLVHAKPSEGVFYRFIGLTPDVDKAALLKFIRQYMEESGKASHGYF